MAIEEERLGYLYIAPWLLGLIIFTAGPLLASLYLSFTDYQVTVAPKWVGLANYAKAFFQDGLVGVSLGDTAYYVFISVPLGLAASLLCAMLMDRKIWGVAGFRTLYYMPSIVPTVVTTLLWVYLLQPDYGLVNSLLGNVGIPGPGWLNSTLWAKPALIIMALWAGAGGSTMIIFLAGLQSVPGELYEAAEVDGAGPLRKFINITLPLLSPTTFFNLIVGMIAAFKVFTSAFVATQGGPGDATRFFVLYLYNQAFVDYRPGYASALAWILFVIILLFTLLQFAVARGWVYYESSPME
ncbi:MAG: carbohydrate ABC transporter permease [Candidatus Dormibacteraceae bacterium]